MGDNLITDLIAAIVAARAEGDGVLTIAAVRARLDDAKLYVARVEDVGKARTYEADQKSARNQAPR